MTFNIRYILVYWLHSYKLRNHIVQRKECLWVDNLEGVLYIYSVAKIVLCDQNLQETTHHDTRYAMADKNYR